jgi:hypothetical protein
MKDSIRLSPIAHDARREANASIAGTLYQTWRAVLELVQLQDDEELYLEGAEDIDRLRKGEATLIQLRRTVESVSLNSAKILQGIAHFWTHSRNNTDRRVHYRYATIAGVSREKGSPFGSDAPGLELWELVRSSDDASVWCPVLRRLCDELSAETRLPSDLRDFLRSASEEDIREQLFVPVAFDTWAGDIDDLKREVHRIVVRFGKAKGIAPVWSLKAVPVLLQRALETAANPRDRRLLRIDFETVFDLATAYPVSPDRLIFATQSGEGVILAEEDVFDTLPPVTRRYFRRHDLIRSIAERALTSRAVFIIGSSGKGKSQLALDHAGLTSGHWRLIDLRDVDAAESERRLRIARTRLLRDGPEANILVEDLNVAGDSSRVVRVLADLLTVLRESDQELIVTSYLEPSRITLDALRLSSADVLTVPNFSVDEIRALLVDRGAPLDRSSTLAKVVWAQSDGGHPTFVDVRADRLARENFPEPSVLSVFEMLDDISDERERARRFITTLDSQEQSMIYRVSLALGPLLREHILRIGATDIPPDGAVQHAGAMVDNLIGPWLEQQPDGRLRVSALLKNAAIDATDPEWVRHAHTALAHAILATQPIDINDAVHAFMHGLTADDGKTVLTVLAGFITQQDHRFWRALSEAAGWFIAVGIDTPPIPALQDPIAYAFLRVAQYRVANVTQNGEIAAKIVDHFERELVEDEDGLTPKLRLMFYATVMARPAESGAIMMVRAFKFLTSADLVAKHDSVALTEAIRGLGKAGPKDEDLIRWAGSLVFAATKTVDDLRVILAELELRGDDFTNRFLGWLNDTTIAWRGVVATLIVSERNSEVPDFVALIDVIRRFSTVAHRAGLFDLAIDTVASAATIAAEQCDDIVAAEAIIVAAETQFGSTPRLLRARAIARHAGQDWAEAYRLFRQSFVEIPRESDDPELPLDMRLAANDAANLGDFSAAQGLLEQAAELLESSVEPSMSSGLLMDAAYSAWRSGHDDDALRLATLAVQRLAGLNIPADDERLQNTIRRCLYIILILIERPASDLKADDPLPSVGFASNPDPLESAAPPIPIGLLFANLGLFELRATGRSTIVYEARDAIRTAGPLGQAVNAMLRLTSVARNGDLDNIADALSDFFTSNESVVSQYGGPTPNLSPIAIEFLAIALLASSAKRQLCVETLMRLIAATERYNLTTISRWLVLGVDFFSNTEAAVDVINGNDHDDQSRLLAAIIIPSLPNVGSSLIFLAQQAQLALLHPIHSTIPVIDVILAAAKSAWRIALKRRALFRNATDAALFQLREAIESQGAEEGDLLSIFRAAEQASRFNLFRNVESLLAGGERGPE